MFDRTVCDDDTPAMERPTFLILRDALAHALPEVPQPHVETVATGLWGLVHGLVSLELVGLPAGTEQGRSDRYEAALLAVGRASNGAPGPVTPGTARGAGAS